VAHSSTRNAAFLDGRTLRKEQKVLKTMESERKISGNIFFFYLEMNISGNIELAIDHENHAPLIGVEKR